MLKQALLFKAMRFIFSFAYLNRTKEIVALNFVIHIQFLFENKNIPTIVYVSWVTDYPPPLPPFPN